MPKPIIPPASEEAEIGSVCSLLLQPIPVSEILHTSGITPSHFTNESLREIYCAIIEMIATDKPVDFQTVTIHMNNTGRLGKLAVMLGGEMWKGAALITALFTFLPTASQADYYAGILDAKLISRKGIEALNRGVEICQTEQKEDPRRLINSIITDLELIGAKPSERYESLTAKTVQAIEDRLSERALGAQIEGFPTGIHSLDASIGGLLPSRYYVIAAAEKLGKTALAESIMACLNRDGKRTIIFQRDMAVKMMVERMACRAAGLVFEDYDQNRLNDEQLGIFRRALKQIDDSKLLIYSPHGMTSKDMVQIFKRELRKGDVAACFLDVFTRLRTPIGERVTGLAEASEDIRHAANDYGAAWMILAHLNHEGKKEGRAPELWDLKWMKGLGGDADWIATLSSEEDPSDRDAQYFGKRQEMLIHVKATRIGGPGKLEPIYFDRPLMTFYRRREGSELNSTLVWMTFIMRSDSRGHLFRSIGCAPERVISP